MSEINEAGTHEVPKQLARETSEEFAKERLLAVWNEHDTTDLAELVT